MGRSRIGWAVGVVAPWCLGIGFVVSVTADAGQDVISGASVAPLVARAALPPTDLVPRGDILTGDIGMLGSGRGLLRAARLAMGVPEDFSASTDEIAPRADLKFQSRHFPMVERAHKGDPQVRLRPTFDTKLRGPNGLSSYMAGILAFQHDESSPATTFEPGDGEPQGPEAVASFEPWGEGESPTTQRSRADASPGQGGSALTVRPAAIAERLMQGATPRVARAVALGSATPAPADGTPVEIVALPGTPRARMIAKNSGATQIPRSTGRPDYAALIGQEQAGREKKCLAEAIYFEARSEPEEGQAAVAQVVLNRVSSGLYPASICGVVYQNRHRWHACQFSFACEGKSLRIADQDSWATARRIADDVMDGRTYLADVGASTHYHANYVRPRWARYLKKMDVIGHHIFYTLKRGQT
ncbi:MAG: cell wall hydrolase [Methylobacteriaceae bacterium]|nr:cell wall hydrolase [Methylobacteriaceae bacterium]